ncbi:MAG: hypothetical protein MZU97_01915 [Bacillus subtilis]|nr:hypothetical protein [Bacillus subtilis]
MKAKEIAEIIDGINSLSKEEALFLMGNENQLVRSIAARAYVDKSDLNIINDLKLMVLDENEYIRDAAIAAICYFNSPELLDALAVATKDDCDSIKLRALTGIADLAAEYADLRAKNILHKFSEYENSDIRNFVNDELSMLK